VSIKYVEDVTALRAFLSWEGAPGRDFERRMKTLAYRQSGDAPRRTGRMAGLIGPRRLQSDFGRYLEGGAGVNVASTRAKGYAQFVSSGTRPHVILPKRGKALRFVIAGRTVFARRVNHPGTRANPYLVRHLSEFVR